VPVFIGLAVANFLLPEAARRRREGLPAGRALAMALIFVVTPGLLLAAVGAVAGRQILSLVFGPKLAVAAPALWVLALAMTYLAVSLMFATYLLGAGYRKIVWALSACTVLTGAGLAYAGGAVMRTAAAGLACQAVTAAAAGALVFRLHRHLGAARADETAGTPASGREPAGPLSGAGPGAPAGEPAAAGDGLRPGGSPGAAAPARPGDPAGAGRAVLEDLAG
jgi:O-antigen/teichoic acid export membrane protein